MGAIELAWPLAVRFDDRQNFHFSHEKKMKTKIKYIMNVDCGPLERLDLAMPTKRVVKGDLSNTSVQVKYICIGDCYW